MLNSDIQGDILICTALGYILVGYEILVSGSFKTFSEILYLRSHEQK